MALPPSGTISLSQIQTEFGGVNPIGLSEYYRGGGLTTPNNTGVPTSGTISLSNFYGAVRQFTFTISSNQTNANLRTLAVNAGWDQSAPVIATIGSGVYVSSNSTGTPALTVNGSFPGGVQLINNGFIIGMGGAGGNASSNGFSGGTALSAAVGVLVNNAGTIGGGGGGGGGGPTFVFSGVDYFGFPYTDTYGGGGGGGGRSSAAANSAGGVSGGNVPGGTGGVGTLSSAGAGGSASYSANSGGAGGNWGAAGGFGPFGSPPAGGSGGAAISGNSNITWVAFGTRLGAIT